MNTPAPRNERGIALITSLVLLIVVTLLATSMYRGMGLQEKIAGNTREKQRSFQAAQSALQYGEWWLTQNGGSTGTACSGVVDGNTMANMKVCSNGLSATERSAPPWNNRFDYKPAGMTVRTASADVGGTSTSTVNGVHDVNYNKSPSLYIAYLGLGPDNKSMLYQVTAAGYGGSSSTTTVVQSVYALKAGVTSLDNP